MTRPELDPTSSAFDPYRTLQVDPEADQEVIQAAYRRLAQKFHPDLAHGQEAATRMIAINAAWELLGEPSARATFDRGRSAFDRKARGPVGARPGGAGAPEVRPVPSAQEVSRDRSAGRSYAGGGYDPRTMRAPDGFGAAGPPPGSPSGSILSFGRYSSWSLGEIARVDLDYLEWLDRMPIGRPYRDELDTLLRRVGRRRSAPAPDERRGLFRRR